MVTLLVLIGITLTPPIARGMRPNTLKPTTTKSSQTRASRASHPASTRAAHSHSAKGRRATHAAPAYQSRPDPERYQEIQKALADRGYFKGEVNGQWGDDSVDALRRFQADQHLTDDGKISALSLTALGLGPKHDGSSASIATPQESPPK